jgi:hypothetical protein
MVAAVEPMPIGGPANVPSGTPGPIRTIFLVLLLGLLVLLLADAEGVFSAKPMLNAHMHTALGDFRPPGFTNGTFAAGKSNEMRVNAPGAAGLGSAAAAAAMGLDTGSLLYDGLSHVEHLARLEVLSALDASSLAPLTLEAQRLLYAWQHPATCVGRTFVVSQGNDPKAGMGSHVHISSHHVAVAFEQGAIFVWADNVAEIYTDPETCPEASNAMHCLFLPPSNCTLQDAFAPGARRIDLRFGDAGESAGFGLKFFHVPTLFQRMWEGAGLPTARSANTGQQDAIKYWFRGQVAAYLMRPNAATARAFRALRTKKGALLTSAGPEAPAAQAAALAAAALPFPPGMVSLHIRHGDKHVEMKLVPTEAYLEAAVRLVKMHPMALAPRGIFMSTEDPEAPVTATKMLGERPELSQWSLAWYDVPRANSNGPEQLNQFDLPRGQLTRIWILQILLALECDAWVGTRGSNWNRIIDELRCVWVPKCQNVFEEVGDFDRWEKCVLPLGGPHIFSSPLPHTHSHPLCIFSLSNPTRNNLHPCSVTVLPGVCKLATPPPPPPFTLLYCIAYLFHFVILAILIFLRTGPGLAPGTSRVTGPGRGYLRKESLFPSHFWHLAT